MEVGILNSLIADR